MSISIISWKNNVEKQKNPDKLHIIGSIQKYIIAEWIVYESKKHGFDINDPLSKYNSTWPKNVSLSNLMSMSAGIPSSEDNYLETYSIEGFFDRIRYSFKYSPGTFEYTNSSMSFAAYVAEFIKNGTIKNIQREFINSMYFYLKLFDVSFHLDEKDTDDVLMPSGSFSMTANDFAKFLKAQLQTDDHICWKRHCDDYGYGCEIKRNGIISHEGEYGPYNSKFGIHPESKSGIVILTTNETFDTINKAYNYWEYNTGMAN